MTSNRGISHARLRDLDAFADGKATSVPSVAYDVLDGMRSRECNSGGVAAFRDRKSTRLNSSHLVISYAVFCLKKKRAASRRHAAPSSEATTSTTADRRTLRAY